MAQVFEIGVKAKNRMQVSDNPSGYMNVCGFFEFSSLVQDEQRELHIHTEFEAYNILGSLQTIIEDSLKCKTKPPHLCTVIYCSLPVINQLFLFQESAGLRLREPYLSRQ